MEIIYKDVDMSEILEDITKNVEKLWKEEPFRKRFKDDIELYVMVAWYDVLYPLGKADYSEDHEVINQVVIPYVRDHANLY